MINYIIISPTKLDVHRCFYYMLDRASHHVLHSSRASRTIDTKDASLRFMSEEQFQKSGKSTEKVDILSGEYFKEQLDKYLADEGGPIHVGDAVEFDAFKGIKLNGFTYCDGEIVTGTVTYVNEAHYWFSVEYELGGIKRRTSFKFVDIGDAVKVIKKAKEKK